MTTTTWACRYDPPREFDPKSDGKSETPSPATSSSIGVWYPAQDDILVVRASGAVPSDEIISWMLEKTKFPFLFLEYNSFCSGHRMASEILTSTEMHASHINLMWIRYSDVRWKAPNVQPLTL